MRFLLRIAEMNPTPSPAPEAPELLPCPCGHYAKVLEVREGAQIGDTMVYCAREPSCPLSCQTRWHPSKPDAIAAWNTRATAPASASGWMEAAATAIQHLDPKGDYPTPGSIQPIVAIIARHAPPDEPHPFACAGAR